MPSESPVEVFADVNLKGSVVIVAFPTTGSAGSIAAQYLIRNLSLPLVGHLRLPDLVGLVAIQDGIVTSAVRIFGGEVVCKIGKECPSIYVVTTELALPPPVLNHLAEAVMHWAARGEAHMLLVLEGVGRAEGDDIPDVFAAAADAKVLKMLVKAGIPPMERALIAGITAQILLEAPARGVKAGGLLVEASRDHPDGRAAAALIEAVARMVPDVAVDAKPLLKEAMALEKEIKNAQSRTEMVANVKAPDQTFI
ncbi:MAG: PAC2 family protein [bacterium]